VPSPEPFIRIRTLLVLAALGAAGWFVHPRAHAAWKLHTSAGTVADYALCMVGPTGPALIRDNVPDFKKLVRRRLIAAVPNERPFQSCAKAARDITGSIEIERAHLATAWSFVEYGGAAADRARGGKSSELMLAALAVTARPLAQLTKQAWPFARDGYVRLMKPSIRAQEAVHPIELPKPATGSGLPSFRAHYRAVGAVPDGILVAVGRAAHLTVLKSTDLGVTFRPASNRDPRLAEFAERCPTTTPGRAFTIGLSDDARTTLVTSVGPDAAPATSALTAADQDVFATACDHGALVAAVKLESGRDVALYSCPFRGRCAVMPPPRLTGVGALPRFPLDIARVEGTTILAVTMHGIVRVASTRDDGQTWTPYVVAFDEAAHADPRLHVKIPSRLLAIGKRVLLYGGAPKPSQTYPVLMSEDFGASWRTP